MRYRKFATIRRFHHHVQIIGNRRLFSTASGGTALAAGTIKDHQDPNLVSLQLLDKEITLSRNFIEWLRGFTPYAIYSYSNRRKYSTLACSKSLDLVVWGTNLTSLVGCGRLTKLESNMIKLPNYQNSVIIGLLLSDGWLIVVSKTSNARLGFKQAINNAQYVWFVFNELSHYCSSYPHLTKGIRAGKPYFGLQFFTRYLPCFTELHSLFYPQGVKVIPNNIYELLTPVALAHLVMGDGGAQKHGLTICTDSYKLVDVVRLMNVLMIRYRLDCTIRVPRENQYRIYIRQSSMRLLVSIVSPYIYSSMLYKTNSSLNISKTSNKIEVLDVKNNISTVHLSMGEAAKNLNIPKIAIIQYFLRNQVKPYKGIYRFKKI